MSKAPDANIPAFVSPLTHDQHAQLGRLAVLWGQIDMLLDQLLQHSLGITAEQRLLLIGERPIGGKLDLLSNSLSNIKDETARRYAREFWDFANQTKTQRNRCFHGVWGWWGSPSKRAIPAAAHFKSKENPVKVTDFQQLERKLCQTSRVGFEALRRLADFEITTGASRLTHGSGREPQSWFREWSERYPLGDHLLGHKHKEGQLPYLEQPLPEK